MYEVKKRGRQKRVYNCIDCKDVMSYELNKQGVIKCIRCLKCYVKHIDNIELIQIVDKVCCEKNLNLNKIN